MRHSRLWFTLALLALSACTANVSRSGPGAEGRNGKMTLSYLDPTSAPGDGGFYVSIHGENLVAPVQVTFGSAPADGILVISPLRIAARPAPGSPGPVDVTVVNGDGQ